MAQAPNTFLKEFSSVRWAFTSIQADGVSVCNIFPQAIFNGNVTLILIYFYLLFQNIVVMTAGLLAISGCVAYLAYMNATAENKKETYMALAEDGSFQKRVKKSKWD